MSDDNLLRTVILAPYAFKDSALFRLDMWEVPSVGLGITADTRIRYRLEMRERGEHKWVTVFEGQDFRPSPLHAIDSDACVCSLLHFLCLKPGDTDKQYFEGYTPLQMSFALCHGEDVWQEAERRFGELG